MSKLKMLLYEDAYYDVPKSAWCLEIDGMPSIPELDTMSDDEIAQALDMAFGPEKDAVHITWRVSF